MKLLVVGGTGMLGHKLFQKLGKIYPETYATVRKDLSEDPFVRIPFFQTSRVYMGIDVSDIVALQDVILGLKPDYILNCVGVIKQHKDKAAPIPCIKFNALLPHEMDNIASLYGGKVIHFSTDCVFDGKRGSYSEEDPTDASDLYGQSKAMGELVSTNSLTLRTSIIGRELASHLSLLDWFLMQSGHQIKGFRRALYSGVTTNQMARVVHLILENYPNLRGLYQIVADPISKYDLLMLAKKAFHVDVDIKPDDIFVIDRSMRGEKFRLATGYQSPPWSDMLEDLAVESEQYRSWGIEL